MEAGTSAQWPASAQEGHIQEEEETAQGRIAPHLAGVDRDDRAEERPRGFCDADSTETEEDTAGWPNAAQQNQQAKPDQNFDPIEHLRMLLPGDEQRAPIPKKQFEEALDDIGPAEGKVDAVRQARNNCIKLLHKVQNLKTTTANLKQQLAKAEAEQQEAEQLLVAAREHLEDTAQPFATLGSEGGAEKPDLRGPGGTPDKPPGAGDDDVGMEEPEASPTYEQWFPAQDQAGQELLLEHQHKLRRHAKCRQWPGPYSGSSDPRRQKSG